MLCNIRYSVILMDYHYFDYCIRVIIIGDTGVGKTSILRKLSDNNYVINETPTIGVDFFTIKTIINKEKIKLHVWDTAGHERYHSLIKSYFRNNAICYIVFDVTNIVSFRSIPMWIDTFNNNTSNTNTIIVILANKIDCKSKRKITYEQGKELAESYGALYIEVSSKASVGLDKMILEPTSKLLDLYKRNLVVASDINGLKANNENKVKKTKTCCLVQ